jgi:uncharacterized membrane protein
MYLLWQSLSAAVKLTHFFFPLLGQVNKTEKEIVQEKFNLEKELAKNKVFCIC